MTTEEVEKMLKDYVFEGVVTDIFQADEAFQMVKAIGDFADDVNKSGFGLLFGTLQAILSERHTLAITKIFETRGRKYPLRSIPRVLDLLEENASLWSIPQPQELKNLLLNASYSLSSIETMTSSQLTIETVRLYRRNMPMPDLNSSNELSKSLGSYFQSRDKKIAHNEAVSKADRILPTWGGGKLLLDYAKQFSHVIGYGFLSISFSEGGNYYLSMDASYAAIELQHLLKLTKIIEAKT